MKEISIKPTWTFQEPGGPPLPTRLLELLVQVHARGSLLAASQQLGMSYRHAWTLIRQGEAHFDAPLLQMERGKGSALSALADKLVWADHRIAARLQPVLDSLASELAAEIWRTVPEAPPVLRIHASHGFAIEKLIARLGANGVRIDHKYSQSTGAVAALRDASCDAAGLHVPHGPLEAAMARRLLGGLRAHDLTVVTLASRRQGLMLASGNPKKVYELADLARPDLRFINRQIGSGTRLLLESLLAQQGVAAEGIAGFENGEFTHAAVAAYVASGMADVGFGLEPPARQFHLDFVPVARERYFLLCRTSLLDTAIGAALMATLREPTFLEALNALPGYDASQCGEVQSLQAAFAALAATD